MTEGQSGEIQRGGVLKKDIEDLHRKVERNDINTKNDLDKKAEREELNRDIRDLLGIVYKNEEDIQSLKNFLANLEIRDLVYKNAEDIQSLKRALDNLESKVTGLRSASFLMDLIWETIKSVIKNTFGITLSSRPLLN